MFANTIFLTLGVSRTLTGGKLHISVVDGDIPVASFYSGANVHADVTIT